MGRRSVVEVRCERCKRVEYQSPASPQVSFVLLLSSGPEDAPPLRHIKYEDLCDRCTQILINYTDKLDLASKNSEAKEEEDQADFSAQPSVDVLVED